MHPQFSRLHHPTRWRFDILRGLEALADADTTYDMRTADALSVLCGRRGRDGRWVADESYPGFTHVPPCPVGVPNRWITLIAMRVLEAYPHP